MSPTARMLGGPSSRIDWNSNPSWRDYNALHDLWWDVNPTCLLNTDGVLGSLIKHKGLYYVLDIDLLINLNFILLTGAAKRNLKTLGNVISRITLGVPNIAFAKMS